MITPLQQMEVTCPFGWRKHPVTGEQQFHNGVDLRAREGTAVRAPFSGTVKLSRNKSGGYQLVVVNDNAGLRAGFAHLMKYASGVADGAVVKEGDVVAFTGSSGRVTGPHLHYTLAYTKDGGRQFFDPEIVVYP